MHSSKWKKFLVPLGVLFAALAVAAGAAGTWAVNVYNSAPPLSSLQPVQKGRSSAIYAADGSLIGYIRSSNIRQPVSTRQLPQDLKDATVAIEDKNFYDHGALDPDGDRPRRAEGHRGRGKPVQGASTITQQLVRNLYIRNPEETIRRKLIEAHLANELWRKHTRRPGSSPST